MQTQTNSLSLAIPSWMRALLRRCWKRLKMTNATIITTRMAKIDPSIVATEIVTPGPEITLYEEVSRWYNSCKVLASALAILDAMG